MISPRNDRDPACADPRNAIGRIIQVYAKDLKAGDICGGSGITILEAPTRNCRRVHMRVRYPNGRNSSAAWNAYTRIRAIRPIREGEPWTP